MFDNTKKHRLAYEYTSDWSKSYIYDEFGRGVASVTDFDSSALDCKSVDHVSYEPSSKDVRISATLASVSASHCVVQLTTFDEFGRVFQQFDDYRRLKQRNEYIEAQGVHFTYHAGQVVKKQEAREGSNGAVYYQFSQEDGAGRVTHYNKGRFAMSIGYSDTGFLSTLNVGGSHEYIQSHSYEFDGLGNLTSSAFTLDGGAIEATRFEYDSLNRVTTVDGSVAFAYDANGNLTAKSGWTQHYDGAKPHAISKRVKGNQIEVFDYDSNGNQISAVMTNHGVTASQRSVVYSARNKATDITVNGELVQFSYDTNNRRFKRVEHNKTIYYVGALEIVKERGSEALSTQTYIRRNIGNDAVKTYHENGQESVQWLFTDHQGSVVAVVNNGGKLLKRFSYDVFGKQSEVPVPNNELDKQNWALETGLFWTVASNQRAYTGHEPVKFGDDTRIIHMNGRIYDADTGRFMQTDPFVQAPSNLQNYNRYSYVLNNPLSYTDPSGYLFSALKKVQRGLIKAAVKVFGPEVVSIAGNLASAACGPAVGACAAYWNYEFTRAMGGSSSQAFKAGIIAGVTAQAFYEVGEHFKALGDYNKWHVNSDMLTEFGGNLLTSGQIAGQISAHAVVGGIASIASGGQFGHGFVSAGVTKGAGGAFLPGGSGLEFHQIATGTVISAVIGGTVSQITGGKFANGARTGAMQYVLNQAGESLREKRNPAEALAKEYLEDGHLKLWEANEIWRANTDPNFELTVDATKLTVTGNFNEAGVAFGKVVDGKDWLVHGSTALSMKSDGSIQISSGTYDFTLNLRSQYPTWIQYAVRNTLTYGGFYLASVAGTRSGLDFTIHYSGSPKYIVTK
ncbi:RHS repeat domain-containing protein [Pseudoalteromonas luteoviolacea]|uniref:RHS repeat domain-containing protein n=4 Tax=Pseudoalteromonas luteoviolacea TaxID=43657 RepID=UPI0008593EF2|nr:RHS repeat-associated core domain-containing protein [Pseudoalteromonas luteoviolacea]AOT07719.1 hypothetical protein S4054249_07610 [Pseudoalteromonas luteoviolacea]AOT12635.1 hypothetical protein S40542_07610 [Pseudoalteromonas luteoviolacea]AOT17549.1 hypothetical protein S4054_07610 [Pseudoalteromonas luteoviolacea]